MQFEYSDKVKNMQARLLAFMAPPFDTADITAILANRVVLEALSAIAKRRSGAPYSPTQNLLDR